MIQGLRLLAAEGARSAYERWIDRRRDATRRRSFTATNVAPERLDVLNLLAAPPWLRLGGLPQQLLARLRAEAQQRGVALLYPDGSRGWRLELESKEKRGAAIVAAAGMPVDDAVRAALAFVGARVLHVEGLAGFDLESLLRAARVAPRLIVSLHDLAALRVHLHRQSQAEPTPDDRRRARQGAALLDAAEAVIFSSDFLRRAHQDLPTARPRPWRVVAPALDWDAPPAARRDDGQKHIAFVGAFSDHKGAGEFERLIAALSARPRIRWSVLGGSAAEAAPRLSRLRRRGVRICGYYRAGSLPRRLVGERIDLALLLSTWPESHGLTLDECRLAGVPVLCFAHGAMGERVRALGGGWLVEPGAGAPGVIDLLSGALDGRAPWPAPPTDRRPTATSAEAARAVLEIYAGRA